MRKMIIMIGLIGVFLTGCEKKTENLLPNVEEIVTTQEEKTMEETENLNKTGEVDTQYMQYYIADSHFYDSNELDYTSTMQNSDGTHIKILDVFTSDNIEEGGEYFLQVENSVNDVLNVIMPLQGRERSDFTYMFVNIQITNSSSQELLFSPTELMFTTRVEDESMVEYGLPNHKIEQNAIQCFWNYEERDVNRKDYYLTTMNEGQTIEMTLLYAVPKECLDKENYIQLRDKQPVGIYDNKTKQWKPNDNKNLKFLKIYINR